MFTLKKQIKLICSLIMVLLLISGVTGCSNKIEAATPIINNNSPVKVTSKLAEVAPPEIIRQLDKSLAQYQPKVKINSPQENEVISDSNLAVKLDVLNLPIFKNKEYEMGPHLHLILDNEPYRSVYDISQPITLENLAPGSHTLRVFAAKPWGESFKNDGSYAQVTFHVFTKSNDNTPDNSLPLLTYNNPKGGYGAEPIMLDYYLTNAPIHLIAQQKSNDSINDWRIKVTINGESFFVDNWQTFYLKGFQPGNNWVQLEFIDEKGQEISNVFNDTVRVINYTPNGDDTLSKLMRNELALADIKGIVDRNYQPIITTPEITQPVEEITPEVTETESNIESEIIITEEQVEPEVTETESNIESKIITQEEQIEDKITETESNIESEIITQEEQIESEVMETESNIEFETISQEEEIESEVMETESNIESETITQESEIKTEVTEIEKKNEPTIKEKAQEKIKSLGNFFNQLKSNLTE